MEEEEEEEEEGGEGEEGFEAPEASLRFQDPAQLPAVRSPTSYAADVSMDDMGDFGFEEI